IFLINGENLITESLLEQYSQKHNNIRFIKSDKQSRGAARNTLIKYACGEVVYFLDDDVLVAKDSFSVLRRNMEKHKDVDIMGGPNLTPPGSGCFQIAQGAVLGSFFGTLWMSKRYNSFGKSIFADERALILCNLAFRRRVFEKNKLFFNGSIVCAEENLLLQQLMDAGCKAMHIPELIVYHERRNTYDAFCRQIFIYGKGRAQAIFCRPQVTNMIYVIPSLFVVYLLLLCWPPFAITKMPLYGYGIFTVFAAITLIFKAGFNVFLFGLILFPTIHIAYGMGFINEIFKKAIQSFATFFMRGEEENVL
ncbi:MAG: glycosyltransferase, partial [Candidatus Omnitrophota bacterium]